MATTDMTPQEAIDKFWKAFCEGIDAANRKHGFGARAERRGNVFAVVFPDGTEDLYEAGASYTQ